MQKYDYSVLLPTHDQVYLLSRFQDLLGEHIRSVLPTFQSLHQLQSKVAFHELLVQLDLPRPVTRVLSWPSPPDAESFPCYLKADHGTAGEGVRLAHSRVQLESALKDLEHRGFIGSGSRYLIQQPCTGIHSVVQSVFQHGSLIAIHCAETHRRGVGGGQGLRVGVDHPSVTHDMKQLGNELQWHGPLFLEYFYDPKTQLPAYIEANPRIGETLNARQSGINLCELAIHLALGDQIPQGVSRGRVGIRSHVDFLLLIAEAMSGARRRTLFSSLVRMIRGTGEFNDSQCEMTRPRDDWVSLIPALAATLQVLLLPASASKLVVSSSRRSAITDAAANAIEALSSDSVREALSS